LSLLRQVLILIVMAAALSGAYWAYDNLVRTPDETAAPAKKGGRATAIEVGEVVRKRLARTIEAVGTTRALRSVDIVPLASGRLVELAIAPGTVVKAGDVLARLDDDLQRADVVEAEALLSEKKQAMDRTETLRRRNTVSAATEDLQQAELATAAARLDRARRRLDDRVVRAPFDGVVGMTTITVGARIDEDVVLTRLEDLSAVEVESAVPEVLYGRVQLGQSVTATSAAFADRRFEGKVSAIDSRVDPVSRAFRIRATISNPERVLPSGMFMLLTITLADDDVLTVPEAAIVSEGTRTIVYVIAGDKAVLRPVTIGQRQAGEVEVTAGLAAGEMVAVSGLLGLRDGASVTVNPGGAKSEAVGASRGSRG
jgi:membrane fusion protein (multidrug efflux system)